MPTYVLRSERNLEQKREERNLWAFDNADKVMSAIEQATKQNICNAFESHRINPNEKKLNTRVERYCKYNRESLVRNL
jgi:hypothetical protein